MPLTMFELHATSERTLCCEGVGEQNESITSSAPLFTEGCRLSWAYLNNCCFLEGGAGLRFWGEEGAPCALTLHRVCTKSSNLENA